MDLKDHKVSLFTFAVIFLLLYLPILGRPLNFEELRLTTYFHSVPAERVKTFTPELAAGSRFSQHWDQYLKLYPPGLMAFYYVWARLSFGDEIFLRLPLFILLLLTFRKLYQLLGSWFDKNEAALLLLLMGLFPLWYRHGTILTPESFGFYLCLLSLFYYFECLKTKNLNSTALVITNTLGLAVNYTFAFVVLFQLLASILQRDLKGRKNFNLTFVSLMIILLTTYIFVPDHHISNPLIFYWKPISSNDIFKFFDFIILGQVRP